MDRRRALQIVIGVSLASQLALFMNSMAAAWTLTGLTDSPAAIALLNVGSTLPTFLLALVAGALADVASRRSIMLIGQAANVAIVGAFAVLEALGMHSVVTILALTAALGFTAAMTGPAWMAVIPTLVPREDLGRVMTRSSGASNIVMAVGPALAGVVVALAGTWMVFALNVAILVVGAVVLRSFKPAKRDGLPPEHLGSAVRMGLRYARHDKPLRLVIVKMVPYAFCAVATMALLPTIARYGLGVGATQFGLLTGAGGIGAIVAMAVGPRLQSRLGPDRVVLVAMLMQAGVMALVATTSHFAVALGALVLGGLALLLWISSVMTVLQAVLPAWIRGRGIAVYLLCLQGTFTLGALFWGGLGERLGASTALLGAAVAMALAAPMLLAVRLSSVAELDTTQATVVDLPTSTSVHDSDGPILVTAEWRIDPAQRDAFMVAMGKIHRGLKRNGALRFHLVEDVSEPGRIMESFTVATWAEFQRMPTRTTKEDQRVVAELEDAVGGLAPLRAHRVLRVKAT